MSSLRKILANQANAKKSTGPKTAAGKARSANNAIRHGLYSKRTTVLALEDSAKLATMREDYIRQFRPTTSAELIHVETMINSDWRMRRVWELEPASIDFIVEAQAAELDTLAPGIDAATRTAFAYAELTEETSLLDSYQRLETTFQRRWERAHRSLIRLRDPKLMPEPLLNAETLSTEMLNTETFDSEPLAVDPIPDLADLSSAIHAIPNDLEDHLDEPVWDPEMQETNDSNEETLEETENCTNKATELDIQASSFVPVAPRPTQNPPEPPPSRPFGHLDDIK